MIHSKVYSHGSIPFSWEDSPGVRKAWTPSHEQQDRPATMPWADALDMVVSSTPDNTLAQKSPILPPPPRVAGAARRRSSAKAFWGRREADDPFLVAYKECTRDARTMTRFPGQSKEPNPKAGARKSAASLFSCKRSVDVAEDSLVGLSQLPPLPSDRMNGASRWKASRWVAF